MTEHLLFTDEVRLKWVVLRDECFDQIIPLNTGNTLDHVYPLSDERIGALITGKQINRKLRNLKDKIPSLIVELLGDTEAVISTGNSNVDELCKNLRAKKRRQISNSERRRLKEINPHNSKTPPLFRQLEP